MPNKTETQDPLGFFKSHSVAKLQKMKGTIWWKKIEKSPQCRKKSKRGTLWSRPVLYVTLETFLVQFLGPTGTFWQPLKILYNFW